MTAYVIDTNIALYLLEGVPEVVTFMEHLAKDSSAVILFSVITKMEMYSSPLVATEAHRQDVDSVLAIAHEVLDVDDHIAATCGELRQLCTSQPGEECPTCHRRSQGKLKAANAIIAATGVTEGALLVTRNVKDFATLMDAGRLRVINPFAQAQLSVGG